MRPAWRPARLWRSVALLGIHLFLGAACLPPRVVLPDTPEANACASGCLEKYQLCKATEQAACRTRNQDCLAACPGAAIRKLPYQ